MYAFIVGPAEDHEHCIYFINLLWAQLSMYAFIVAFSNFVFAYKYQSLKSALFTLSFSVETLNIQTSTKHQFFLALCAIFSTTLADIARFRDLFVIILRCHI